MTTQRYSVTQPPIENLFAWIRSGEIASPEIQRPFVWDAVKVRERHASGKAQAGDSWRHGKITLKPLNPDFKPIALTGADEVQLQVVAELVEVLRSWT